MHDTDSFARMPALDSIAEQPSPEETLLIFEKECEVGFKEEVYLVRDNGAVLRRLRPGLRRRKLDEVWTFGTLNRHSGYFEINGHVVHRIVALAFHGPAPSAGHVVDHIDTNRLNNRPDNLRWVTRLENILLNPITRRKIELAFGSLEAFFENPGAELVSNWDWMRTVTKEEAQESRKRWLEWVEKGQAGKQGGAPGDWLFQPRPASASFPEPKRKDSAPRDWVTKPRPRPSQILELKENGTLEWVPNPPPTPAFIPEPEGSSLTPGVFQRNWRTPTEFPQCPESVSSEGLQSYLERLVAGAVFGRNRYGESTVVEAAMNDDGVLSIVCSMTSGVKPWSHAKVYVEGDFYCHEAGGTFFEQVGAMKAHCIAIGAPTDAYPESIDDYC
ncbi:MULTISPECIES: HNH endonuclease [unclassified Mesorhizobium]|uniref:HNH endonuclease signature motif containing protein n=1 Tax=unclassified Mesorhizobium TaxID=325217 RepID=UPI002417F093|nr:MULTISPECIES: HNH endonuclease [unclassified Mesorhizobium]MDG4901411.1 HNH endonuclease [Mesorhizobium sp. WSM4962]MDG4918899.1 HNH endonuclease [Mesorhizobium sp. WSM4989]